MKPPITEILAENIATLRKARSMTLARLSRLSRVPVSTLSTFESGRGNPSFEAVLRVAEALGVSLEELISLPALEVQVVRGKKMPVTRQIAGAGKLVRLLPDPFPGMDFHILELTGRGIFPGTRHGSHSWRYFYCFKGEVKIRLAGQEQRLGAGDAILFSGEFEHSYQAVAVPCVGLLIKGYAKRTSAGG
jgi:transcriptional regulator with XRE-family HTH domain